MTDWTSLNYVAVDAEGNGQQPPELVELAVATLEELRGQLPEKVEEDALL